MGKKDFMRGVEAAISTNEAFMRKQAAATEELGKRIIQKIDEQGEIIDVILDTLNAQEKKELYDLQSAYDIADLGENEKEVLASFLLTLITKHGQNTDNQKDYYFAVKKHLGVTDVSPDFNLSLVENVDSRSELKAMFQTVCEFLFLKTGDTSFMDEFDDELNYFDLSRKNIREIIDSIQTIYDHLGLRGIVEHYIPAEPEDEDVPEHYGLVSPVIGELVIDDSNRDIPAGTEKLYEDLRIVVTKQLHVDGKAVFRNCQIVLAWDGLIAINLREENSEAEFVDCEFFSQCASDLAQIRVEGKCVMKDCLIDGVKYRYGLHKDVYQHKDGSPIEYNSSFIEVDGYDVTAELVIDHCHFTNCVGTVINADGNKFGDNFNITVKNCLVDQHTGNFLMSRYADQGSNTGVNITNSTFENVKPYEKAAQGALTDRNFSRSNFLSLIYVSCTTFSCSGCTFEQVEEEVFEVSRTLCSTPSEITACRMIAGQQSTPLVGTIKGCEFSNMSSIVFGRCGEFDNNPVIVSGSKFTDIKGKVIVAYGKIEHCHFVHSTVTVDIEGKPTGKDSFISEANDITFTNCTAPTNRGFSFMDKPCFLQAVSYLGKPGICVLFNGCKFENCTTSGNYINTEKNVFGAFDRIKVITLGREYGTSVK